MVANLQKVVQVSKMGNKNYIKLSKNKYAIVDSKDYDNLNQYTWHATRHGVSYCAARKHYLGGGKDQTILLHHAVIGRPLGDLVVDHINHDPLDNHSCNLRIVSQSTNCCNRKDRGASKYAGVSKTKSGKKWRSTIRIGGKTTHLGYFHSEIEAHVSYRDWRKVK